MDKRLEKPTKEDVENLGVYTNADGVVVVPLSFEEEQEEAPSKMCTSCPWNIGCNVWCKKYFWEGQAVTAEQQEALDNLDADAPFTERILVKYRRQVGILIPLTLYHFWWWSVMIHYNLWYNFKDKYFMSLVMIVGGFVAGGTTEGGGAVAFPTMTLAFGIAPKIARDFSLLIQASGMSAASFVILFMKVKVVWHAIVYCTLGGLLGSIPGLYWLDPYVPPAWKKMFFSCVWFSFACALLILNWKSKRLTYDTIPKMNKWKAVVLFVGGFIGGVFTSIVGTGLDICVFSVLTIIFRVSEKIATPTAVCLMAWNSILTAAWRHVMMDGIATETWEFLSVTFQVVTIMAPVGAIVSTHMHRQVLAAFVYILDFAALIGAFVILPMTVPLATGSVAIIIACAFIFFGLTKLGGIMQVRQERQRRQSVYIERRRSLGLLNPNDISHFTKGPGVVNEGFISNGIAPHDGIPEKNDTTRISKM